jgi:hypothetical protein
MPINGPAPRGEVRQTPSARGSITTNTISHRFSTEQKMKIKPWLIRIAISIAIMIAFENKKSKSAQNFSIKVC